MFDVIDRAEPLDDARLAEGAGAASSLSLVPACNHYVIRGDGLAAAQLAAMALPVVPCRATHAAGRACLWLGPDEWLLISDVAVSAGAEAVLQGQPYSLVDVSHRDFTLNVTGIAARRLLNAGCPLDLDDAVFPVGMCTRTLLGKAPIVLWRVETDVYTVICWQSFVHYVWDFLIEARALL